MLKQTSFLFWIVLLNAFSEPVPVPGSKKLEVELPPEQAEQQNQLVPILVVSSFPSDASVTVTPTPPSSQTPIRLPARITLRKNESYTITISKEGYRAETRSLRTDRGGEYPVSVRLDESKLPAALSQDFEIPSEGKDAYGNAVRQGFDKESGLPVEIRHQTTGMHLVLCPAGSFTMGSPANEKDRDKDEAQHKVTLSKPFYLGKYEVTVGQFETFVKSKGYKTEAETGDGGYVYADGEWQSKADASWKNPYFSQGADNPVVLASWNDAKKFCDWSGLSLPSEAQWEYACRAGTQSRFFSGEADDKLGDFAWYSENSGVGKGQMTHPVGQKKPNGWGLYDMHGNVWEWCEDRYGDYPSKTVVDPVGPTAGVDRVFRGGSWYYSAWYCRSAFRYRLRPGFRSDYLGFRLARQVQQ
ncbi:MAG: formylglycine-generating enzyme family protein [Planctomycetota bacterium]|nr:formylglycine-generating enzyme family protein [Planctomycetota bacterium]